MVVDTAKRRKPGQRKRSRLLAFAVALCGILNTPRAAVADDIVVAAVNTRATHYRQGFDAADTLRKALYERAQIPTLLNRSVRIIGFEDDCSAQSGEAVARMIAAQQVALVVGHICSAAAVAAAAVYAREHVLFISPGARAPRLTTPRAGPTIFRLAGRDDSIGADTAQVIQSRFNGQRVAIAHDKSVQARGFADGLERQLSLLGRPLVHREAYVSGEKEYHSLVGRMLKLDVQVLVIPTQPIEAGVIFRGLAAARPDVVLIGSDALAVSEMEATAEKAGERLITMLGDERSGGSAMVRRTRSALEVWTAVAQRIGSFDSLALAKALTTEAVETTVGPLIFNQKGDAVLSSYTAHTWHNGSWKPMAAP